MSKALNRFLHIELPPVRKLAWFGFSADPPTLSHRALLDAVLGSGYAERVIVFPAGPLDYKEFSATDTQRVDMIDLWMHESEFGDEVFLSLFDLYREIAMPWYVLWNTLHRLAPQIEHHFVVGSDQYLDIAQHWYKGSELLERGTFLIVPRVGYPVFNPSPNHVIIDTEAILGSSTDVRNGELSLVDDRVRKYILSERIYELGSEM